MEKQIVAHSYNGILHSNGKNTLMVNIQHRGICNEL